MSPSSQQRAIFDAIDAGDHNILVDAKAGSGKTTTIVEGTKYVKRVTLVAPDVVFIAFNKNIVTTLASRTKAFCTTFHSLGFRALKDAGIVLRNVKVDSTKCRKILYNIMESEDEDFRNVIRLVALLKSQVHEVAYEDIDPRDLIEFHNIDFIQPERGILSALRVLKTSDEQLDVIDFDDMLHLPVKFGVRFEPRDWIFVDEAQDLNAIQHEIIDRMQAGRIVAVGDPNQAIYGFRGAHADSMSLLAKRFAMRKYPLSTSFRCPKLGVQEARKYLAPATLFDAYEKNPEGSVERLGIYDASRFVRGSAILCRNTAPLVAFCYALLQRDVPCRILGKDIGAQLATLVKKLRAFSLDDLLDKLSAWEAREVVRAEKEDRSPERIRDQADCLRFFVSGLDEDSRTVDSLLAKIELMFTDEANGSSASRVTLSTIHKAKGLEFPVVFLLDWNLLPSAYAKAEWQQRQERNLQYVAVTRSMDKLYYIPSNHWKD